MRSKIVQSFFRKSIEKIDTFFSYSNWIMPCQMYYAVTFGPLIIIFSYLRHDTNTSFDFCSSSSTETAPRQRFNPSTASRVDTSRQLLGSTNTTVLEMPNTGSNTTTPSRPYVSQQVIHSVWKSTKMSHLEFSILAFSFLTYWNWAVW